MDSLVKFDAAVDERLQRVSDHLLRCPGAAAFDPITLDPDLWQHLYIVDVLAIPGSAQRGLRIRLTGTALDTMFGRRVAGERLDHIFHGSQSAKVLAGFQRCAASREPVWMRQVVAIAKKTPRFIEGVAVYLEPDRIYGGLVSGDASSRSKDFEIRTLDPQGSGKVMVPVPPKSVDRRGSAPGARTWRRRSE